MSINVTQPMEAQLTFFLVYVMILEFHRGREFQVIPIQSTSAVAMDLNVNKTKEKNKTETQYLCIFFAGIHMSGKCDGHETATLTI